MTHFGSQAGKATQPRLIDQQARGAEALGLSRFTRERQRSRAGCRPPKGVHSGVATLCAEIRPHHGRGRFLLPGVLALH